MKEKLKSILKEICDMHGYDVEFWDNGLVIVFEYNKYENIEDALIEWLPKLKELKY